MKTRNTNTRLPQCIVTDGKSNVYSKITCNAIFSSIEEAGELAISNLESMYKLQQEEIDPVCVLINLKR